DFSDVSNTVGISVNIGSSGASNAGTITGSFTFSAIKTVKGTSLADTFKLSNGYGLTGSLDGAGGGDTLDYSLWTTGIRVSLTSGSASAITGGVTNIRNLTGGSANDVLIGDSNGNTLIDNAGQNILVGNGGNDTLAVAGTGYDILIGGDGTDSL